MERHGSSLGNYGENAARAQSEAPSRDNRSVRDPVSKDGAVVKASFSKLKVSSLVANWNGIPWVRRVSGQRYRSS